MITDTEKLNAVVEVLKGQDTKTNIAKKFNISTRSLGRYIEQFEDQAKTYVTGEFVMNENILEDVVETVNELEVASEDFSEFETADDVITTEEKPAFNAMSFMVQQATVNPIKAVPEKKERKSRSVKTSSGPSIKQTVIDLMTRYKDDGKTSKEYREECILEIMQATGMERAQASKYYAGYKKPVFG